MGHYCRGIICYSFTYHPCKTSLDRQDVFPYDYCILNLQESAVLKKGNRSTTRDMTRGPIAKEILLFAVPLMLGNIFQMLYNTVDSIVVGNFVSTEALAAVGATAMVTNMAVFFFNGFSIGAGVVIGRLFGARELKQLHRAIETTMAITLILCVVFTAVGVASVHFMLVFMSTPENVMADASTYLRIYFAGVSGLLIYNTGSGILRAVGDTTRPLYFLILTSALNIVLDLLFVLAFHMGIAGVAYATILAQFISAVLTMRLLMKTDDIYRVTLRDLSIDRKLLGEIISVAVPTAIQAVITSFSNVFVQSYINHFGSVVMAGWACYNKLDSFVFLPMETMAMASTTFVSQNVGAGDIKRVNQGTKISIIMTEGISAAIITLVFLFADESVGLFTSDLSVIKAGAMFVHINMYFMLFNCVNHVLAGALRGRGDSTGPMIIMLACFVGLRQTYLFLMTHFIINTPGVVGFGYPVGWSTCCLAEVIYFFVKWNRKEKGQLQEKAGLSKNLS